MSENGFPSESLLAAGVKRVAVAQEVGGKIMVVPLADFAGSGEGIRSSGVSEPGQDGDGKANAKRQVEVKGLYPKGRETKTTRSRSTWDESDAGDRPRRRHGMPESGYDGWKLISFGRKHNNYEDPEKYVKAFDRRHERSYASQHRPQEEAERRPGLLAVLLRTRPGAWSLIGEGTQDQWDTAYLPASCLDRKPGDIGAKTLEDRAKDALASWRVQPDWMNGNIYWFGMVNENGEEIESIGGLVGDEALSEVVGEELKAGDNLVIEGDAAWMKSNLTLPAGVNLVDEFPKPTAA